MSRLALRTETALPAAVVAGISVILLLGTVKPGRATEQWNFYMHQSAPNFATSRGAKLFTEEIEKATGGELKVRLHLAGTLQINASNITQAVGENVVQIGDDLFNSGNIPVAGIPRLPMLIQSYEDFAKANAVLKPYIETEQHPVLHRHHHLYSYHSHLPFEAHDYAVSPTGVD